MLFLFSINHGHLLDYTYFVFCL